MKLFIRVLLVALVAWSAFANTVEGLQHSTDQIMIRSINNAPSADVSIEGPTGMRDLRNGNYSLVCQTEDFTYLTNMLNYVYSPVISVPAGNSVLFDFFIRGGFTDPDEFPAVDYWGCEITPNGGANWYPISNPYGEAGGTNYVYSDAPAEWSSFVASYTVDGVLNDYAGTDIQFRWYFQSDADTPSGEGLFVDDVSVTVDGGSVFFADFEDGSLDGWVSEDGTATPAWWHQTTSGAFSGQSWAMNDPDIGPNGGYDDHWYQVLDSPPVTLPATVNTITFQQHRNVEDPAGASAPYNGWDGTNVRISADNGAHWEVLTDVTPAYTSTSLYSFGFEFNEGAGIAGWGGSSGGWQAVSITIPTSYQNTEVLIRFAFASDPSYNTNDQTDMIGWIIDDIDIAGVLLNDGETAEGWVASSNVPIAGDLWHLTFTGSLPIPSSVVAEAGDSEVNVSWAPPISGDVSQIVHDNPAAWRYFLSDTQPYGVMFEAAEENSYLGAAQFFMISLSGAFAGTADAYVYSVGVDNMPDELLYTQPGVVVQAYPSATTVDFSGTGLSFDTGQKFALCVGNFTDGTAGDQGLLADSLSVDNPATGNSVVWSGTDWVLIQDAYTDISNLAIRAEIIIPDPGFSPESYNVYRRLASGSYGTALASEVMDVSYLDTGAENGETYYYAVSANYENGESSRSTEAMAEPESQTVVELGYDDGSAEFGFNINAGNYQAVKFTPAGYPALVKRIKVYVNDDEVSPFIAYVWDDNGPDGAPLDQHIRLGWSFPQTGWNVMDLTGDSIWITGGSFYLGLKELAGSPSIGADTDGGYSGNSYYGLTDDNGDVTWDNMSSLGLDYNLMFRVDLDTAFVLVGIEAFENQNLPSTYSLKQNYPNPFNPSTEISYSLPESGNVEIKVFDLSGRQVDVLVQEHQSAGSYRLTMDGSHMNSGIYIYTLNAGNVHLTRKMILLK
ncbi:MAG: T9SS type A sorting domain-containing protein [Candidatus Marinimicrobia bacterium]|nr:T9SS type A sorting domain-containing protein [Candidatus Neomarinimicrobiota bacterium]